MKSFVHFDQTVEFISKEKKKKRLFFLRNIALVRGLIFDRCENVSSTVARGYTHGFSQLKGRPNLRLQPDGDVMTFTNF